jgi:hypothetical protein
MSKQLKRVSIDNLKPEDFLELVKQMQKAKRVSVEHDPEFDGIREDLLTALRDFADAHPLPDGPMSYEGIVLLYEKGFLRIESDGDFWRIAMCDPDEAPQLENAKAVQ